MLKKTLRKIVKWSLYFLSIPFVYLVVSLILTSITIEKEDNKSICSKTIFLSTNGVHLDVILPKNDIDRNALKDIINLETENFISFGWGDENFYINTPTWGDLTFGNAIQALFFKSTTLMHVTRYEQRQNNWIEIKVSNEELKKLNDYILGSFDQDQNGNKMILESKGYSKTDDFYKAKGSYSCFNTCNSWINFGFKESGLKSCYWTPFDFGLMKKYK